MIIHEFKNGIYPTRLWITTNLDSKEISKLFSLHHDKSQYNLDISDDWIAHTSPLLVRNSDGKYGVLISINIDDEFDTAIAAHEACHYTNIVYDYICEDSVNLGGEQHAYFMEWAVRSILDVVKTTKEENKMSTKKTTKKKGGKC